jgi:type IV pilus assembly protein PilE
VILIISVLSSFSYSTYTNYITKSHRLDGKTALLNLANRLESYHLQTGGYTKASIATGSENDILSSALSTDGWYILKIIKTSRDYFLIAADANNTQAIKDPMCPTFTIDSNGVKGTHYPENRKLCW